VRNSKTKYAAQDALDAKRKQFNRSIFVWLDQVARDKKLPSSAFVVIYVISQHINMETGEAFPSTETIGELAGLHPFSVRQTLQPLVDAGHLAVQWGKPGRGHPHRYRMVIQPGSWAISAAKRKWQDAAVSDEQIKPHETAGSETAKPQTSDLKPQECDAKTAAFCHELQGNYSNQGAALHAAPLVEGKEVEHCFQQFAQRVDVHDDDRDEVFAAFELALEAGYSPDELLSRWIDEQSFDHPADWLRDLVQGSDRATLKPHPMDDGISF
jgi:hypothetical protein